MLRSKWVLAGGATVAVFLVGSAYLRMSGDVMRARVAAPEGAPNAELAALLVKSIGMFPPGSFVRLANGEIAVVTARTDNASLPELRSVVAMDGSPRTMPSPRDPQDPLYAIVSEYPISECRFPMAPIRRLWT